MSGLTQKNRLFSISDFSLGEDTLVLTRFEGHDYISDLFEFSVDVISQSLNVKPASIIGKSGTVTFHNEHNSCFHGFVSSFFRGEIVFGQYRRYRLTLVPWLWFLSKTNSHRIFQEKNAKEIIVQIFQDYGFTDFEFRAAGGTSREYCVQYNESDLHFISRLLEEEGAAYYFKHSDGEHKMIIVDQKNAYDEFCETNLEYSQGSSPHRQINRWEHRFNYKKGQWSYSDYNFKEPTKKLYSNATTTSTFASNSKFEHYEYPGMYDYALGNELVKIRLEAEESGIDLIAGSCDCTSFYAGGKFKLEKHENGDEIGEYVVVSIQHSAFDNTHTAGDEGNVGYVNNFVCIPSEVHFRPQATHIKSIMKGPQSAIVTGPSGEEIYVDELGRVKVQFYWDRDGRNDENTTCFVRVMQTWSGAQWGSSFIPRIGHEVIVDFLDGDPDRPIITGTVYNGKNKPPFDSKTKSGIRTRSTKSGSASNCNELIFDDKKNSEQIFIHAEKNMDTEVENDESLTVEHDRNKHVMNDENSNIDNNRNKSVGNNESESIGKNKSIDVGDNHTESIGKNMSLNVGKDYSESIAKNVSIDIGDNHSESVGKSMTISIGKDLSETVAGKYTESVTKEYGLKAKSITLQADDQITLKTGSAKIIMKKNGDITISGKNVNVKGSGNVVVKGSKTSVN